MDFEEHESGQLRIGAAGDQLPLLPLPDALIPASDGPALTLPAVEDLAEMHRARIEARGGSTRREKLERRAEKRREWAGSRAAAGDAAYQGVRRIMDGIPMGQPILVGHHSEKRHRRDVARIESGMAAAHEHGKMAERHESAADGLERALAGAIYSDDVDAPERLEERIRGLEAERDRVKRYNQLRRKRKPANMLDGLDEDAAAAGLTAREVEGIRSGARAVPYQYQPHGAFPAYHLQNLGGNIKRNRDRLEQLRRAAETVAAGGRGRPRIIAARFASTCAECGQPIEKGATIAYYKLTREAVHAACEPAA